MCEPLIGDKNYVDLFNALHAVRDDYYNEISDFVLSADDGDIDRHIDMVIDYLKKEFNLVQPIGILDKELMYFKYKTDIAVRISEHKQFALSIYQRA